MDGDSDFSENLLLIAPLGVWKHDTHHAEVEVGWMRRLALKCGASTITKDVAVATVLSGSLDEMLAGLVITLSALTICKVLEAVRRRRYVRNFAGTIRQRCAMPGRVNTYCARWDNDAVIAIEKISIRMEEV
jgi:hypothetical protein